MVVSIKMRNEAALRSFLWAVIAALIMVIAWLAFAYQRPGMVHTALAPMINKVDSMIGNLPALPQLPSVMLTEPETILFMGTDVSYSGRRKTLKADHTSFKGNSDTMLLGFLNPPQGKASILHIPRDTEAYVGNLGIQKINTANCVGGPELARSTVSGLLAVPVHHYIVMNLQGLVDMVNELGGITVEVQKKMSYMDWTAKLKIDLEPGVHTLTGNQAMGFVRFRHDALGDIGRVQRQQVFLQAVARKMTDPRSWMHVPALLQIAQNNIETDMNQIDIIAAMNFVHSLPKNAIKFVMLPGQFSSNGDWIATNDGRVLAQQLANPEQEFVASRRNISVCVINASSDKTFGGKLATALRKLGYVTNVAQDDQDFLHKNSQIIVQNGNSANAKMLQQDLGNKGDIVNASVGSLISNITIVAHDDLNLDLIKMSSADAPYVVQTAMPAPIVAKAVDTTPRGRRGQPKPVDEDNQPASNGIVPDGTSTEQTPLDSESRPHRIEGGETSGATPGGTEESQSPSQPRPSFQITPAGGNEPTGAPVPEPARREPPPTLKPEIKEPPVETPSEPDR